MKAKFFISLIIIIFTFSIIPHAEEPKIIVIDPGHGGVDGGTEVLDVLEKDLNLEIALKLEELLISNGYQVIMTRRTDESLCKGSFIKKEDMINRVNIINSSNALMCISIHMNYFTDSKYRGSQVFYSDANSKNQGLSQNIQESLEYYLNNTTRSIVKRDNVYLLTHSVIPTALVECGFLSNKEERELLKTSDYQYLLVNAIYSGMKKEL